MLLKSYPTIITHSVSAGALLCDSTEANAFIAPTGIDFTPYRGKQIEIWSGSTLWARAWVSGTAPTGDGAGAELLGADIFSGWNLTSGWFVTATGEIVDNDTFRVTLGTGCYVYKPSSFIGGGLYKGLYNGSAGGGGTTRGNNGGGTTYLPDNVESYFCATDIGGGSATALYIVLSGVSVGVTCDIVSLAVSKVLDPAPTGALLLSSNGGSRGWAYKHASFNPNAAVTLRILARRIASAHGGYYK